MSISWLLIGIFTFVELNCENLFDCVDDPITQDEQFLPSSDYHWTLSRYWRKINRTGQTILSCGEDGNDWSLPDMVALCEVENDSCMVDLTKRSLLRKARYEYVMTHSPDERGIDVALLYSPLTFQLLHYHSIRVNPLPDMRPTRDILYACGLTGERDTLHVFVVHAPSRSEGEQPTRAHRRVVANRLLASIDSLRSVSANARIMIAGDFNDYSSDENIQFIGQHGLKDVSSKAVGRHGAKATYRYQGEWGSLDHIFVDDPTSHSLAECSVHDAPFLLEKDEKFGGVKPFRNYLGPRYKNGYSDHLPLVARFNW
ncbi:MAG: endonuclease [Prevotella sp.]